MKSVAVVIPSIRNLNPEYVKNINRDIADIILVDDTEEQSLDGDYLHLKYRDQDRDFPDGAWKGIWKRKTAGVRNYGIWWAWKSGYQYILTTDDDCIIPEGWVESYVRYLGDRYTYPRGITSNRPWFNTVFSSTFYARGFPYEYRPGYRGKFMVNAELTEIPLLHFGLWSKVLDLNAIDKLSPNYTNLDIPEQIESRGTYFSDKYVPVCAMNMGAVREAALGLMQLPIDWTPTPQFTLYRVEDIWGGLVWQVLMPYRTTFGDPKVIHTKDGNLTWEIWAENYPNLMNLPVQRAFVRAASELRAANIPINEKYKAFGKNLTFGGGWMKDFTTQVGNSLMKMGQAFDE